MRGLDLVAARRAKGRDDQGAFDFAQDAVVKAGCREVAFMGRKIIVDVTLDRRGEPLAARRFGRGLGGRPLGQLGFNDIETDDFLRIEGGQTPHQVLQFAHISGPAILLQALHRRVVDRLDRQTLLRGKRGKMADQRRNVRAALAQRRQADRRDIEPIEQIVAELPCRINCDRSRWVAAMMRTLARIGTRPPTAVYSPSCSTRSKRVCASGGMSPISSRNRVPPFACSKRPMLRAVAPVKAPFSWPNSSLSISSRGIAAMLIATKGPERRFPKSCSARATSSFPVPLSPVIMTVRSVPISRAIAR